MTNDPELPKIHWVVQLRSTWNRHETLRFMAVGAYNALFGFAAFSLLQLWLGKHLHYLVVLLIAHVLAVTNAFIGHRHITFRVHGHVLLDFLRFNLSYLGLLLFGLAAMPFLIEVIHFNPIVSNALILGITTLASFIAHKKLSFRRKPRGE